MRTTAASTGATYDHVGHVEHPDHGNAHRSREGCERGVAAVGQARDAGCRDGQTDEREDRSQHGAEDDRCEQHR